MINGARRKSGMAKWRRASKIIEMAAAAHGISSGANNESEMACESGEIPAAKISAAAWRKRGSGAIAAAKSAKAESCGCEKLKEISISMSGKRKL